MNISFKNLFFSFVVFLIIFSIVLAFICIGIFDSKVLVAKAKGDDVTASWSILLHKAVVFKSTENGELDYFVLALLDKVNKTVYLTPIFDDYLTVFQSNSGAAYVSRTYASSGNKGIIEIVRSFSGLDVSKKDIIDINIDFETFKSSFTSVYLLDNSKFHAIFECDKQGNDFTVNEFNVILDEISVSGTISKIEQINIDKTVKKFKEIIK